MARRCSSVCKVVENLNVLSATLETLKNQDVIPHQNQKYIQIPFHCQVIHLRIFLDRVHYIYISSDKC